ncbi:MAG TPA: ABC-F family ATP-binding cassette domain-containing protein [Verrucomicrobiae bacterium]|nr:ABC-F family ATP-binding cassette domain-containing protein [Verrucomicrobiae bacterium]
MLLSLDIQEKTVGTDKTLLKDCSLVIQENSKVGLIGRNGAGKTTLFNILSGNDTDFLGTIEQRRNLRVVLTKQEHFGTASSTPLQYVIDSLPRYAELTEIITNFTEHPTSDPDDIQRFFAAQEEYTDRTYWNVSDHILESLGRYGISREQAVAPFSLLSGGEKRFLELVRVSYADADLILLDEPTNHMDYVGKAEFIRWLKDTKHSVCLISHDRDVLNVVNEIVELKDQKLHRTPGNYAHYLKQNSTRTLTAVSSYEESLKLSEKLHNQWMLARVRKLKAKSDAGRNNAKTQELRFEKAYKELQATIDRPSFWIDKESVDATKPKALEGYHKYKSKNIRIRPQELGEHTQDLLTVEDLSLGYTEPLFDHIKFTLEHGSQVQLKGRNGAGKSTLIQAILAAALNTPLTSTCYSGMITVNPKARIGVYKQEVPEALLDLTLNEAVTKLYQDQGLGITGDELRALLGSYLFEPMRDGELQIRKLSGGQKARFQLISMLSGKPNILILDEPTNHLDLPSIEELESALTGYEGALLYVSHDSFFVNTIGGDVVEI